MVQVSLCLPWFAIWVETPVLVPQILSDDSLSSSHVDEAYRTTSGVQAEN